MNKITKNKDFKTLIILFSIETLIVIIMFIVAGINTKETTIRCNNYNNVVHSMKGVNEAVLDASFNGNGLSAFNYLDSIESNDSQSEIELCKFFTFNLSDDGITSNLLRVEKNTQLNGIASNTATSTVIKPSKSQFELGNFVVHNDYVPVNLDLEEILSKPLVIEPMDKSNILIYHVHASEGYCVTESDKYKLNSYSIKGEEHNVVASGNVLETSIINNSGINVIHDKTLFEEGLLSSVSYNNAAKRLDEIYAENNNIKLQVDLHRNSAELNGKKYGPTVNANGIDYAQISFVIGLDWDPATGDRSDSTNPYWEDNFKLCMLVIEKLEEKVPGICRQIDLRKNPYNQNYAENSLLIEVGFAGNLYTEADATAKLLGEVLSDIYG